MTSWLPVLLAGVIGFVLAWAWQTARAARRLEAVAERGRAESERRAAAEALAARLPALEETLATRDAQLRADAAQLAQLQSRLQAEQTASTDKLKLLTEAESALSNAFKALSAEALRTNNESFLQLARTTLEKFQSGAREDLEARQKAVDALVLPLRESLQKVDGKLGEIERSRIGAYAALTEQLKSLVETHIPMLRGETASLVRALRAPAVRGRWGEMQLRRVVEMAGMLDHCDFLEQESRASENGPLRPDLVIKLPGGKQIVVDAKTPLEAYLDVAETEDDPQRLVKLADHARQVRDHMIALGRKGYWEQFSPSPDFVVMFLPGEMFFSAALQADPALIEFGVNERVIPATPTTLIALLRAVAYGWRQEALTANAQEVATLGKQLYERIATLSDHWSDVGARLGKAVESYNKSVVTLESRVLVSARRFRDLKAGAEDVQIADAEPIEIAPRALGAPEIAGPGEK